MRITAVLRSYWQCDVNRASLLALPSEPLANFRDAQQRMNRDDYVEVAKAYYPAQLD